MGRGIKATKAQIAAGAAKKRAASAARSRTQSAAARDISPMPRVVDRRRRESCRADLERYCLTYFPKSFPLPFSADHRTVLSRLQAAILTGGLFALAMPRGSGKTTIVEVATTWAMNYGHRLFPVVVAATDDDAKAILTNVKAHWQFNDLLADDFPEICYPIRRLEGDSRRCIGQILDGRPTRMIWGSDEVVLPFIAEKELRKAGVYAPCRPETPTGCGAVVMARGLTGALRGLKHTMPTGASVRPDFVILDDPQTHESAWSDGQCEQRWEIIHADVLGLAGPGKKIAGLMPCTVIRRGDLADRMLDRRTSPEWQAERMKMVYAWPGEGLADADGKATRRLWDRYREIRDNDLQAGGDGSAATEFYRDNRAAMDAGAVVGWDARHDPGELSALQHAMNLRNRDEAAFAAEYQNEPLVASTDTVVMSSERIAAKTNGMARGEVPESVTRRTAFVDVHDSLLYWAMMGWDEAWSGWVLDYGAWPEQGSRYFAMRDAAPTLSSVAPGAGVDGAIMAGLRQITGVLIGRGAERVLIDTGYKPDLVYSVTRGQPVLFGSKGLPVGAANTPMSQYRRRPGEVLGDNWVVKAAQGREQKHVAFDANHWKSWLHSRLSMAYGDRGSISLFGVSPAEHRLLADHLTAEVAIPTEGRGRKIHEWRLKPAKPDNHWLDCLVGCAVAASMLGVGVQRVAAPERRVVRMSEIARGRKVWRAAQ